ncbi:MAG: PAS domain S-box protein [Deltaproteobacteria bacterium]|nr:PAS domain S-box protein [Deltaproteobacteria bacterium]
MNTLLVIDDEESTRELLKISLESDGYEVYTAEDGPSGLRIFSERMPPIVLTDIKMPGMDGIEVLRRVKEINSDAEVIVITGHGEMNLAIKALQLEASDFINKPISDAALNVALRRAKERIWMRNKLREYTENLECMVKETTEELQRINEFEHNLIQVSMDGIIANDRDGDIIIFNEGAERITGYTREEAISRLHVSQLYAEGEARKIKKKIYSSNFGGPGRLIDHEADIITKSGERVPILLSAVLLYEEGREVATVGFFKDMREIKRLQKELMQRYEFEHNLIQTSMDGIIANDPQGRLIIFNEGAERITGYSRQEALQQLHVRQLYPPGVARKIKKKIYGPEHGGAGRLINYEVYVLSKSGECIPILLSATVLHEEGKEVATVGYFKDMRDIKRLEKELIDRERMAAMGQAMAGVAHGVKNILHGMKLGGFMVDRGLAEGKESLLRKGWSLVGKNIERISRLTLDMLSYVRSNVPDYEPCSLNAIIEEVCELVAGQAAARQVNLLRELDPSLPLVEADAEGMHTCLLNLVTNAIEAFPETGSGGVVTVISRTEGDDKVSLQVKDTGRGMSPQLQKEIFQNLFSTKGARGTGLGLAITQKIVHEHGGSITVESAPGEGSCFTVTLPLRHPARRSQRPEEL